jgi:hypothetical protein
MKNKLSWNKNGSIKDYSFTLGEKSLSRYPP